MLPSWGVKRPIRWLHLEADLLRRTTDKEKSYLHRYELEKLAFSGIADDDDDDHYYYHDIVNDDDIERRPCLLVSEVKQVASAYNMNDHEVECFLDFHHALGDLICCTLSNGERCIITNAQRLVNRFGELVSELVSYWNRRDMYISQRNKAIVSNKDFQFIWERCDADVQFLIDLMISFDFIFPLDNQKLGSLYAIPGG